MIRTSIRSDIVFCYLFGMKNYVVKRMDEMFVVLGRDLIQRIAARTYCGKIKCDIANQLVDTNYGGTGIHKNASSSILPPSTTSG
jgi:hypothetical protein